jgi:dTDP-D-glucose 4,6-dehydratase
VKEKILVTGGAGFIGTNFVDILFDRYPEYHVLVLDALTYAGSLNNFAARVKNNPEFTFVRGDVRDVGLVLDLVSQVGLVIHFAAETHVARSIYQVQHHISSTEKARAVLGVRPGRKFEEGLEETIKWYADNREWWQRLLPMRKVPILTKNGYNEYY